MVIENSTLILKLKFQSKNLKRESVNLHSLSIPLELRFTSLTILITNFIQWLILKLEKLITTSKLEMRLVLHLSFNSQAKWNISTSMLVNGNHSLRLLSLRFNMISKTSIKSFKSNQKHQSIWILVLKSLKSFTLHINHGKSHILDKLNSLSWDNRIHSKNMYPK